MATSNRDIKLTVEAQALGVDSIKALAAQVRGLGKSGEDAAPEFNRLAAELDALADQAKAVLGLKQLESELQALSAAQANAAKIAEGSAAAYNRQKAATDALRDAQRAATEEWNKARLAQIAAREALDQSKRETEALTAKEKARNAGLQEAKKNLSEAVAEQRRLKVALDEAGAAAAGAAKEERSAAREYRNTAAELTAAETALRARTVALAEAQAAATKLGVQTQNLSAAETTLRTTLVSTAQAAEANRRALVELAEATARAAEADRVAARAQQALDGIRKAAYQKEAAAQVKAEADATRDLAQAQAQAERVQVALANIRRAAYQQDVAAKIKAETAAQREANAEAQKAERIQTALNNIRRIAYQQDQAAKIRAEAEAQKALAEAAEKAGRALDEAFGTVGVRSVRAIQAEMEQTRRAMALLEQRFKAGEVSAYDLSRAMGAAQARMQGLSAELAKVPAAAGVFERMNATVLDLATRFGAVSAAMATVGYAAKPILDANLALDSMRRVLTTVYGSAEAAAEQIEFVRRVADESGLSVLTLGDAFTKFAASAKTSGIDAGLVREVFQATANAAGNLGLSTEKTTLILNALGQMANKGTVSMEELRQQLGDNLPGALSLLARGLGITEPQLVKLVESGKLLTTEALGPLAQAMATLAAPGGHVEGLRAALGRLGSEVTLTFQKISDTSVFRGVTSAVGFLADNFSTLTTGVKLFAEALVVSKVATAAANFLQLRAATTATAAATAEATVAVAANTTATAANTAAITGNTSVKAANATASTAMAAANVAATAGAGGLATAITAVGTASASVAPRIGLVEAATSRLASIGRTAFAVIGGWPGVIITTVLNLDLLAKGFTWAKDKIEAFLSPADQAKEKFRELERGADAASRAIEDASQSIVRAKVIYAEQADALAKTAAAAEKNVKATKDLGDAAITAAELSGQESAVLLATVDARQRNVESLERLAEAKRAEAELTAGLIAQTERSIEGKGRLSEAQQRELDQLEATRDLLGELTKDQQARLASLQAQRAEAEKSIESTREQIKLDKLKLDGQRAAAEEAAAAAVKERALADAAELAAAASRNQTASLYELRQAHQDAQASVDVMRAALERGEVTQTAYEGSVRRAAVAQGLYKEALKQAAAAGVDLAEMQTGVDDAFFKSIGAINGVITSLEKMGLSAEQTAPQLAAALNKRVEAATTRQELELVTAEILRARDAGLIFGADAAAALEKVRLKAESLSPALRQAQQDAEALGIKLKDATGGGAQAGVAAALGAYERLKAGGKASSDELQQGFINLANRAIEASGGIVPEWVKVEAATRGVRLETDALGKTTLTAAGTGREGLYQLAKGFDTVADATKRAEDAALRYGSVLKQTKYDADKFALDSSGNRFTVNGQLPPPDNSGDWEFVGDVRVRSGTATASRVNVPGQGYWQRKGSGGRTAGLGTGDATPAPSAGASPAVASGGTRTIKLDLTGFGSTSVNVASDADAVRLEAFLNQLQTAAARAGG